jgi:CRP-like cAMP-binding protein
MVGTPRSLLARRARGPSAEEGPVALLRRVPLLAGLDVDELEQVAAAMSERRIAAGRHVVEQGSPAAGFFVIEAGEADVTVDGRPRGTLGVGDYFGEIALMTGSSRTATVTARTDLVCHGLTPWEFKPLVERSPTIAWKLLTTMAERLG